MPEDPKFRFRNLFKDTIIYGAGRYTSQIIGIFILPIYTRYFSPAEYGIIEIINTFLFIGAYLIVAGTDVALRAFYYKLESEKEKGELVFTTTIFQLINAILFTILCTYFSPQILKLFSLNESLTLVFRIASLNLISLTLFVSCQEILKLRFKSFHYSIITVGEVILVYALSIYLIVVKKMGVQGYFIGKFVADAILALISVAIAYKHIRINFKFLKLKAIAVFGVSILASQILSMVTQLDRFILAKYATLAQVGIYSIAFKLCSLVSLFATAFFTAWGPTSMSIQNESNAKQIYSKILNYYSTFILTVAFLLGIFAREILSIIVQKDFAEAYKIVGILGYAVAIEGFAHIVNVGLLIRNKPSVNILGVGISSVFNIILLLFLIPRFGIYGASATYLISRLLLIYITAILSNRFYKIDWEIGTLLKVIILNIILYSLLFVAGIYLSNFDLIFKIIGVLVYFLIILKLRVISSTDLANIQKYFPPSFSKLFGYISR